MKSVVLFSVILLVLVALAVLPAYVPTGRLSSRPESSPKPHASARPSPPWVGG
jgi:hypothetical protein